MVYAILPELDDFSGAASLVPRLCTGVEVHLPQAILLSPIIIDLFILLGPVLWYYFMLANA